MDTPLGRQVKALRKARKWSTQEFARQLTALGAPITWRTVETWEQGLRCPRPEAMSVLITLGLDREGK